MHPAPVHLYKFISVLYIVKYTSLQHTTLFGQMAILFCLNVYCADEAYAADKSGGVQECDATMPNQGTVAGNIIFNIRL